MNVKQLENGNALFNAINKNGESLRRVRYLQKHVDMTCNYVGGLYGTDLKYLSKEELKDILCLVEKYLTNANQRLIDEFDEI